MTRHWRRGVVSGLTLALVAGVAVGCGDDGDGSAVTAEGTETTAPETTVRNGNGPGTADTSPDTSAADTTGADVSEPDEAGPGTTVVDPAPPSTDPSDSGPPTTGGGTTVPPSTGTAVLAGDGIRFDDGSELILGEASLAEAEEALAQRLGAEYDQSDLPECGSGPMISLEFPNLRAYFSAGDQILAGWGMAGGSHLRSPEGIGLGSTRQDLEAAYAGDLAVEHTSLGSEWHTSSGLRGLVTDDTPQATVYEMWAGDTCIFR